MSKFIILLNGDVVLTPRLKKYLTGGRVIGVDGGIRHADTLGLEPEVWIGDFDSSSPEINKRWANVDQLSFPKDKDDSDGALAIAYAIEHGASEIVLLGASGGRFDMVASHHLQLIALAKRKIKCCSFCSAQQVWPFFAEQGDRLRLEFEAEAGGLFSVVGFSDLERLSISGVKWPLDNRFVELGSTLTLSNVVTDRVQMQLSHGYGVVVIA